MIGAGIAPGMNRHFLSEQWTSLKPAKYYEEAFCEAQDNIRTDIEMNIQGYDIDDECVRMSLANARLAGVDKYIHFQRRPVEELRNPKKYGFIITNPPYGERLEDKAEVHRLYTAIGQAFGGLDSWSYYIITAFEDAERYIGKKADKNRKLYNGMMKTYFLQYMGPKPPRREK